MSERWSVADAAKWLRVPEPADDKYRRGVLGVRTGSALYPGAAVLSVTAAWRSGVGMVRYVPPLDDPEGPVGLLSPTAAVLAARPETVFGEPTTQCDAWVLGSGTDPTTRSSAEQNRLTALLSGETPLVVDAGALELTAARKESVVAPVILTPHRGEFATLWRGCGLGQLPRRWAERGNTSAERLSKAATELAACLNATVLLKGSVTVAAAPTGRWIACGPATPWLASAGTGDVLAGILGALLASHSAEARVDPEVLAMLGATASVLHDTAARIASGDTEGTGAGHPITASDVSSAIPLAWDRITSTEPVH